MPILSIITEFDAILDALALASSLLMILFLLRNRRQYGSMHLTAERDEGPDSFADEVSLQMISQQSQKAYDNLQRSLTQEFESLRMIGARSLPATITAQTTAANKELNHTPAEMVLQSRSRRYRMADEMIAQGAGGNQILQRCGLAEGELELLQGLRQLEQGTRN